MLVHVPKLAHAYVWMQSIWVFWVSGYCVAVEHKVAGAGVSEFRLLSVGEQTEEERANKQT